MVTSERLLYLVALNVRLGVDASLPVPEVERAVHLDDGLRLGAVVAQVALERGVLRVYLKEKLILFRTNYIFKKIIYQFHA